MTLEYDVLSQQNNATLHGTAWANLKALLAAAALLSSATAPAAEEPLGCAGALNQPIAAGAALSRDIEILSWNIQKSSNQGWSEDLSTLADAADLVFIQEASLQASIPEQLARAQVPSFAPGYRTSSMDTGVMTLSASTPSLECHFTATEPWLGTPKATSITEYPIAGRQERLLAINLHAVNFAVGLDDFRSQFAAIGVVLSRHQGPIVFAGDLNTWSEARQALVDAFMAEHELHPVRFDPDLRTTAFGQALDHVYVRGLEPTEATVVPVVTSDHNALQVRLTLGP